MTHPTLSQFRKSRSAFRNDVADFNPDTPFAGCSGWEYADGLLFIEWCPKDDPKNNADRYRCHVDLFGGDFIGSQADCEAELWRAAIDEDIFDGSQC